MELIWSQPGFKYCDEPLNLRNPFVRECLGITEWKDLYDRGTNLALHNYFQGFCAGQLHFLDPNPLRRYYRPLTHRIVFKIIHGGEDRIDWFRKTFNGRIVYLLRHPIAVSLSREVYPRLHAFLDTDYRRYFTHDQLEYSQNILDSGTKLQRGVLSWCLQNAVPLGDATAEWAIVSYEQMILDPHTVLTYLADRLELPKTERMLGRLTVASSVKRKSDEETQKVLESEANERSWLVEKWRKRVDRAEERGLMEILKRFQLDVYQCGGILPVERLWISAKSSSHSCTDTSLPTRL